MIIYIGADHRGFKLKESLIKFIKAEGFEAIDLGAERYDHEDDYPDFAVKVAEKVSADSGSRGIVICGSGGGVSIVANKYKGIRSFIGFTPEQAKATKLDEDTNVLSLAADYISEDLAKDIVHAWLSAHFSGEDRHMRRLEKITAVERKV